MGMKSKLLAVLALVGLLLVPQQAAAHVILSDTSNSIGTVLHVMPDDDPIAGKAGDLFFDVQAGDAPLRDSSLQITGPTGETDTVEFTLDGSLLAASYAFPAQGVYEIKLRTTTDGKGYTFKHVQRVSRGVAGSALDRPTYAWAEMGVLMSGIVLLIILIIGLNRRKDIKAYSKF